MTSQTVTVVNQLGMHARAAAKFVHLAGRFDARVRVARDRREMDGKSIMGILLLAAARGSTITISAEGADEADAVNALVALVEVGLLVGAGYLVGHLHRHAGIWIDVVAAAVLCLLLLGPLVIRRLHDRPARRHLRAAEGPSP